MNVKVDNLKSQTRPAKGNMKTLGELSFTFQFRQKTYDFSKRTYVMGVLNVTPDSFSDGGRFYALDKAVEQGLKMADEGADIIDIGGESSRPGAEPLALEEELERVIPVIQKLAPQIEIPISIDTCKAPVAEAALSLGAEIVNDISSLRNDSQMAQVAKKSNAYLILMHMQGTPRDMQSAPSYNDAVAEIGAFFEERIEYCRNKGINPDRIILDPGIGFGKTVEHNLEILRHLSSFASLGRPLLVGVSRKSFIGKLLNLEITERLEPSLAAGVFSVLQGASILRVHDVGETVKAIQLIDILREKG